MVVRQTYRVMLAYRVFTSLVLHPAFSITRSQSELLRISLRIPLL